MIVRSGESALKTIGFAAVLAFLCALAVSTVVHYLRPIQNALASIDYTRAVVEAAGSHSDTAAMSDIEIANAFRTFELRLADLDAGTFNTQADPAAYDYRSQLALNPRQRPRYMPLYLQYEEGRLVRAVLPFYGQGMWSTIHGLLALEGDLLTVSGLLIFEHGETPGIGDRIEEPKWLNNWRGKRLYDRDGNVRLHVSTRPAPEEAPFAIDAITGATVTVNAVEQAVVQWAGADGYGPLLAALRKEMP